MKNNPLFTYLTFVLDKKVFAIPVVNIKNLLVADNDISTPYSGGFISGIVHRDGDTFPFINLKKVINPENRAPVKLKDLILVNLPLYNLNVALAVDAIGEIIEYTDLTDNRHRGPLRQTGMHAFSTRTDKEIEMLNIPELLTTQQISVLMALGNYFIN